MKAWKQRAAWRRFVCNALLFAFVSSSCSLAIPTVQAVPAPARADLITTAPTGQAATPTNYITRVFTDARGIQMTYYLFLPLNDDVQRKYPLVLLLHGGDERANVNNPPNQNRDTLLNQDYVRVWGPGIPGSSTPAAQAEYPSFIVVPQVDSPQRWVDVPASQGSYTLAAQPTASLRMAKEIVDALQKHYPNIDPHRLYITGISMGGYGVWDAIERWPDYFAAAAPLAGAGDPSKASRLARLPIWAFHGSGDGTVPVSGSRDMIQAIKAAGGHPRYTEYASAGHDIWMTVYSTPAFFSWLFSQSNLYPRPASTKHSARSASRSLPQVCSLLRTVKPWLCSLLRTFVSIFSREPSWLYGSIHLPGVHFSPFDMLNPTLSAPQTGQYVQHYPGWDTFSHAMRNELRMANRLRAHSKPTRRLDLRSGRGGNDLSREAA